LNACSNTHQYNRLYSIREKTDCANEFLGVDYPNFSQDIQLFGPVLVIFCPDAIDLSSSSHRPLVFKTLGRLDHPIDSMGSWH